MYLSYQDQWSNGQKDSTLQSLLKRHPLQFVATTMNTGEEEHNEPSELYNDVPFKTGNSSSVVNPISGLREQSEFLENLNCDLQQLASPTSKVDEMEQTQSFNDYCSFQNPNSGLSIYSNIKYLKRLKCEFRQQRLFQTLKIDVGIQSQSFVTSWTSVKTNHTEKNKQSIPNKNTSITTPNEEPFCSTTSSVERPLPERNESTLQIREKTFKNVNSRESNSSSTNSDHLSTMPENLCVDVCSTTENMLNVTNNESLHFDYSKRELKDMFDYSKEELKDMLKRATNEENLTATEQYPVNSNNSSSTNSNHLSTLPENLCADVCSSAEHILDITNNKELGPLTATNDEHLSAMNHYSVPAVLVSLPKSSQKRKRIDNLNSYSFSNEKQETSKHLPIVCSALPLSTNDYGHSVQKNIDLQAEYISASSVALQERLRLEENNAQNSPENSFHIHTKKLKPTLPENINRNEDSVHSKNAELGQLKRSNYPNLNSCKSPLLKIIIQTQNAYNKIPIQPPIIEKTPADFGLENTNSCMSSCCFNSINKRDAVSFPKNKYYDHSEQNISSAKKSGGKTSTYMSNCSVASTSGLSKFQNSTNMNSSSASSNSRLASCKSIEMKLLCQRVIPLEDVIYYLLDWKPIWLQKQMKTGIHPDIYSGLNAAKYSCNNSRKYIDINFQLQSDKLWLMLYESWKKQPSSFNANFDSYEEHPCHFENSATVTEKDIVNNQDVILLNNQDVILVTFTTTKFERQCLFGFAYNVIVHNPDISGLFIEFTFLTTEKLAVKLNSTIDVQKLCNIKDILEQFSPTKVMHSSLMDEIILDPSKHKQHISVITIPSCCSSQLKQVIHSVIATSSLFILVAYPPNMDSCTILSSLIPDFLLRPSTVLVCLRNAKRCFKMAEIMASMASDFILALEEDEVRDIPVELREFTLRAKATALCDISQDDALLKVLRDSQTVLTDMSSVFLSRNRNMVLGSNLVCLIDEAHMCTNSETFVPLSYSPCTVVLLGKTDKNLFPYRWSSCNPNSLFLRLFKENTAI